MINVLLVNISVFLYSCFGLGFVCFVVVVFLVSLMKKAYRCTSIIPSGFFFLRNRRLVMMDCKMVSVLSVGTEGGRFEAHSEG